MESQDTKIDFRAYIGLFFFRWQIIALCFFSTLLAGVLYMDFIPKVYMAKCKIMIYRDPNLYVKGGESPLSSFSTHSYLLRSEKLRERVADKLADTWETKIGSRKKMILNVDVNRDRKMNSTLNVSVRSREREYCKAYLLALLDEHRKEWDDIQKQASIKASSMLEDELARLEEQIKEAEDAVVEYKRLNDIARTQARGTMEARYLEALMSRHNALSTELMLLDAETPSLKNENAAVISTVHDLTRETGQIETRSEQVVQMDMQEDGQYTQTTEPEPRLPEQFGVQNNKPSNTDMSGLHELRIKLANLQQDEKDLLKNLEPQHQKVVEVRKEIEIVQNKLQIASEVAMEKLQDRHKALKISLNALESAEYKWKNNNLLASQRSSELKRLQAIVSRYEGNYNLLYTRLHDIRISEELQAEYVKNIEEVNVDPKPVWPDPIQVLLISLLLGLGLGFGFALFAQTLDNKIQSIADVEDILGVPYLGGVPFWVHSGLEKTARPIVTEEHSTGAIEAYRALRTNILAQLKKCNDKVMLVTSADSKEGKTLTTLNLAIMIAQIQKKVLLIDMDLRRGRLHRSLGLDRDPGVSDVMQKHDTMSMKDVVRKSRIENLYFIPAGVTLENTAELLQSIDMRAMLDSVRDDYDYILIDTSPVLRVTDTVILASQGIGEVLYVARVNKTPKPMVRYSIDMLKDSHIMGLVMNSIEMHKISSLYYSYQYPNYAYYSNAYAYGYDYYYYGDKSSPKGKARYRRNTAGRKLTDFFRWIRKTFLPME